MTESPPSPPVAPAAADRRRLRFFAPHRDGDRVLATDHKLPAVEVDLVDGETTIAAAWRLLRSSLGLNVPIIDCYVDQSGQAAEAGERSIPALIELAPPPDSWRPPDGWRWIHIGELSATIEPGLATTLGLRLDELLRGTAVPMERVAWSRPGWYEQASQWVDRSLADTGHRPPTSIVPFRHWGISAVLRADSPDGRFWFKASFPPFRSEPAISRFLHQNLPGRVGSVVAVDADRGWTLLGDLGRDLVADRLDATGPSIDRLVEMQTALLGRNEELLAAGVPHRPLGELPAQLRQALVSPAVRPWLEVGPARIDRILDTLDEAIVTVDALGLPETLVHGDFHPGNAMITANGVVLFDWSDAAVSNPVIDVATWASWFGDDPGYLDDLWSMFGRSWATAYGVDPADLDRRSLNAVAGAYHTISYARIVEALESHRQVEHAEGIGEFFSLLDQATPT